MRSNVLAGAILLAYVLLGSPSEATDAEVDATRKRGDDQSTRAFIGYSLGAFVAKAPIALDELIANTPVMGGWQKLPIERLSRVDYRLALGLDNIPQRLLDYHDSASTRDFVFEAGGLLSKHVDQLLTHAESTTVEKVSPVRDASRKINQAFAHGLITQKDKSLLHRVRNVRNRFAHDVDLRHFEADPRVLGWVRSLPCSIENQPASAVPLRLRVLTTALNLHESMSATLARLAGGQLTSETVDLSSRKS